MNLFVLHLAPPTKTRIPYPISPFAPFVTSFSDYRPSRDREPKRRKASEGGLEEDSRLSSIQDISMGYFQQMATGHQFDRDETQQGYQNIRNSLQTSTSAIPSFLDAISGNRSISIMGNAFSSMDQHTLRYDPTIIGSIGTLNRNPPFTAAASLAAFGSFFQVPIIPTDIGGRTMPSFSGGLENTVAVVPRPPEERILPPSVFDRIYNPNQVVGSSNLLFFDPTRASPSQHHFSEESKQNEDPKSENIFEEPLCDDLEPTHLPPPA